ncbi:unnamed protein product [Brassica oleracea var. botrytis]
MKHTRRAATGTSETPPARDMKRVRKRQAKSSSSVPANKKRNCLRGRHWDDHSSRKSPLRHETTRLTQLDTRIEPYSSITEHEPVSSAQYCRNPFEKRENN